jgi:hypothetical protein
VRAVAATTELLPYSKWTHLDPSIKVCDIGEMVKNPPEWELQTLKGRDLNGFAAAGLVIERVAESGPPAGPITLAIRAREPTRR